MKQYDSYKDSGVKWIGEVPSHWEVVHLKQALKSFQDGTHGTYKNVDHGRVLLSAKNVTEQGLVIGENERIISEEDYSEIVSNGFPKKGDVLLCCVGTIGRCCIFVEPAPVAFQRSVTFLRTNKRLLNKMLLFILKNQYVVTQLNLFAKTSAQSGVYMGDLVNFHIAVPPLLEQQMIVDYLDKKCSEIDNVISAQQKRIALLQELKQSVITHAVTKGLDPNVKMKDSGVEWIGEVPSHWEILRGKYMLDILSGFPFDSKKFEYDDNYMPLIRIRDINSSSTEVYYSGVYPKESVVKKGEVLIGMDGDFNISRWNGPEALLNQRVCKLSKSSKMNTCFAFYMLSLPLKLTNDVTYATTVKHLSVYDIYNTFLPVPTIAEQEGIANYLDKKCASIDSSISKAQHQVELLQEYKQSLITEVVTGKRKVL